ncbi:MAG TPA: hypothetical protein PLR06_13075, partial [Cyclobacteriaceae bacterium]|nr:hypothetical protein [Cyclobacteriaceae bacterium]
MAEVLTQNHGYWLPRACMVILLSLSSPGCDAQDNQLWLDVQAEYPWAGKYNVEGSVSYQTVTNPGIHWRNYGISGSFEYQNIPRIDLIISLPSDFTMQKESFHSIAFAPSLGVKYYFSQGKKIDFRIITKWEERFFYELENDNLERSNRIRLKGELWYSINGPNLFTDKLRYALLDYEEFFVLDQQVDERYAFLRRARLGIGYRLSYGHRFELIYTVQSAKDE